jgi:hypothetical protein
MFVKYDMKVHLAKMHVFRMLIVENNGKIMQITQQKIYKELYYFRASIFRGLNSVLPKVAKLVNVFVHVFLLQVNDRRIILPFKYHIKSNILLQCIIKNIKSFFSFHF